jgi:spore coat protein U-like protein
MRTIKFTALALSMALVGAAPAAIAATAITTMGVSALVLSTCIVVATPVSFGDYSLSALDASGLITVTCTPDVSVYTVALDKGTGPGATTTVRKMTPFVVGASTLNYSLYRDSNRTQNWGDTVGELQPSSEAASTLLTVKTFPVYGRLMANQAATTGIYLDTIQVTVTY